MPMVSKLVYSNLFLYRRFRIYFNQAHLWTSGWSVHYIVFKIYEELVTCEVLCCESMFESFCGWKGNLCRTVFVSLVCLKIKILLFILQLIWLNLWTVTWLVSYWFIYEWLLMYNNTGVCVRYNWPGPMLFLWGFRIYFTSVNVKSRLVRLYFTIRWCEWRYFCYKIC